MFILGKLFKIACFLIGAAIIAAAVAQAWIFVLCVATCVVYILM